MDKVDYVIIIQCDIALRRCSGFACTNAFYNREGKFELYKEGIKYISLSCGGCCGKAVSSKLEHFSKKLLGKTELAKENVNIHLASCMSTDNYHYDRCPHIDYIKSIILKKGYNSVVEGSYISKGSNIKRKKALYKTY